jgi:soluble lytic murein transglycosylase-like protein
MKFDRYVAKHHNTLEKIRAGLVAIESGGKSWAISSKGALGLWQIMPATWAEWAPRAGVDVKKPLDPVANEKVGRMYLAWLLEQFESDLRLALAAYNHGIGNVFDKQKEHGKRFEDIRLRLPKVTQNYVAAILSKSNLA